MQVLRWHCLCAWLLCFADGVALSSQTRAAVVAPELRSGWTTTPERLPALAKAAEYESLRGEFSRPRILNFFAKKPHVVAGRFATVASTLYKVRNIWEAEEDLPEAERTRADALRSALAQLGPVAVKLGQTLSQRPDLVGDEAAFALRALQTRNVAFSDEVAFAVLREELGVPAGAALDGEDGLFQSFDATPVAVASLGQVYRAVTRDGRAVAVKVQRPDATSICAVDYVCFVLAWAAIEARWRMGKGQFEQDIGTVVDRVAQGIWEELDYVKEAKNALAFEKSLQFLGFVGVPVQVPELSRSKVLTTEWVQGQHLEFLSKEDGLQMTRMAVEACTASLVLTGFVRGGVGPKVHADPHEGNLMLHDDGRIIFLDFGLMSTVQDDVMESFATGIQACLAEDYETLGKVFQDVGFVTTPMLWRVGKGETYEAIPDARAKFTEELRQAMARVDGGTSRFGALAEVLNKELAPRWKMFTPPYVLLLIRTFLTLEGIAAQVDPSFNIYAISAPWAIRRSLSPSSADGIAALRSTLFAAGTTQADWTKLLALLPDADADAVTAAAPTPGAAVDFAELRGVLLGAPAGRALRQALVDFDSAHFLRKLASGDGIKLRRAAAAAATDALFRAPRAAPVARPSSPAAAALRVRQQRWQRKVTLILLRSHIRRQFASGFNGAAALASLFYVAAAVFARTARNAAARLFYAILARRADGGRPQGAPTLAGPAGAL